MEVAMDNQDKRENDKLENREPNRTTNQNPNPGTTNQPPYEGDDRRKTGSDPDEQNKQGHEGDHKNNPTPDSNVPPKTKTTTA
jgi:hypothetical protein